MHNVDLLVVCLCLNRVSNNYVLLGVHEQYYYYSVREGLGYVVTANSSLEYLNGIR